MKTRFAPSPTGYIHLGNLRTALFNVLVAHSQPKGVFLVRIEDTDKERSDRKYYDKLVEDLTWLGILGDEGPAPMPNLGLGPYFQSEREGVYEKYYQELEAKGLAYPCYCSELELDVQRKVQLSSGQPPRYAGTCRDLSPEQRAKKAQACPHPTLRFRVKHEQLQFTDLVQGLKTFNTSDIGDFIIRKQDGGPTFMFCNAIDDALMGVTHAIRGEDHLTNTPRQRLILEALGLRSPDYAHIPMIVGDDGKPLSKRNGSLAIFELEAQGYLPGAVLNHMARLGHYYESNAYMSLADLAANFKMEHIGRSPAKFEIAQLHHWQREAIKAMEPSSEAFMAWMKQGLNPVMRDTYSEDLLKAFALCIHENVMMPKDVAYWEALLLCKNEAFDIEQEAEQVLSRTSPAYWDIALKTIHPGLEPGLVLKSIFNAIKAELSISGKNLFMPMRAALCGTCHGPEFPKVEALLGLEKMQARMVHAKHLYRKD